MVIIQTNEQMVKYEYTHKCGHKFTQWVNSLNESEAVELSKKEEVSCVACNMFGMDK